MGYEIDYMPVGEGEQSGDAIALRFGNLFGNREEQTVVVIDGGDKKSGERLVEHIKRYYGTDEVDLVVSTHPDSDHISGLSVVLENMRVANLLMHRPWEHASEIKNFFKRKTVTASGIERSLEKSLNQASDLEDIAISQNVKIVEPFNGVTGFAGKMYVLGPSIEYYRELLASFRGTPQPKPAFNLLGDLKRAGKKLAEWVEDRLEVDLLGDDDTEPAENNSSAVLLFVLDGQLLLFTGDAGITALTKATDYAEGLKMDLSHLNFLDVPHHGSRHNAGSSIYKRVKAETAFISASKDAPKHPAKKVVNALIKNGTKPFSTEDVAIWHKRNAPPRSDYGPATQLPWSQYVEGD